MKILDLKIVNTKSGAVKVLVTTPEADVWVPFGQWQNKCKAPLDSYVGGDMTPQYYQEGETMINGELCTKSDVVLSDFIASVNPEIAAMAHAVTMQAQVTKAQELNALFNRKRAEAKAKATA